MAGRLFLRPLSSPDTPTLGIGGGGSVGQGDGPAGTDFPASTTRLGREAFFRYTAQVVPDGTRWRLAPQAYLFGGPFGLIGEFVATQQSVEQSTEAEFVHWAWNVTGSYVLTSEEATFGRVRPDAPFDGEDQWGAVELTARVHGISIDDDVFDPQQ